MAIIVVGGQEVEAVALVKTINRFGNSENWTWNAVREDGTRVPYLSSYGFIGDVQFPDEAAVEALPTLPEEVTRSGAVVRYADSYEPRPWEMGYREEGD